MPKTSGHRHVLILTDRAYVDGRMDLQERETMKECTGGGPSDAQVKLLLSE